MLENKSLKLTQFSHGSGCGCKIAPQVLEKMLAGNRSGQMESLWVGNQENDDAAVLQWEGETGLVSTVDFFTPIVDNPFVFGQAAAANALSDVYAMGGKPMLALAILGWPVDKLPTEMANQVIEGARFICREASIPLAGGHTIDSGEPFFGLAVNGKVERSHLKKNHTAQPGDQLFLTKPLGVGILAAGAKRGLFPETEQQEFHDQLARLNLVGEALGAWPKVHAMTDVTGFGLMGHLCEMAEGSNLTAEISFSALPVLDQAWALMAQNCIPDATYRNWNAFSAKTYIDPKVDPVGSFQLLPDPQTNGGLLFSIGEEGWPEINRIVEPFGLIPFAKPIGRFLPREEHLLKVIE